MMSPHQCFFGIPLLRPALIRDSRVLPSTPPLFHNIERHAFDGQFGEFSVSGIHRCPQAFAIESEHASEGIRLRHCHSGQKRGRKGAKNEGWDFTLLKQRVDSLSDRMSGESLVFTITAIFAAWRASLENART